VTAVQNHGGGDILELKLADGKEALILSPTPPCRMSTLLEGSSASM
jgi:hypothetical protein